MKTPWTLSIIVSLILVCGSVVLWRGALAQEQCRTTGATLALIADMRDAGMPLERVGTLFRTRAQASGDREMWDVAIHRVYTGDAHTMTGQELREASQEVCAMK